jgi:hypothetical protein
MNHMKEAGSAEPQWGIDTSLCMSKDVKGFIMILLEAGVCRSAGNHTGRQ